MLKLSRVPVVGSCINLTLSFIDNQGKYYVPADVCYTFLAQNSDKQTWSVVSECQEVSVTPASVIHLTIDSSKNVIVDGTTLVRKLVVTWQARLYGEVQTFIEEVDFSISPQPVIVNSQTVIPRPSLEGSVVVAAGKITFNTPVTSFIFSVDGVEVSVASDTAMTEYVFDSSELVVGDHAWEITSIQALRSDVEFPETVSGNFTIAEPPAVLATNVILDNPESQSLNNTSSLSATLTDLVAAVRLLSS